MPSPIEGILDSKEWTDEDLNSNAVKRDRSEWRPSAEGVTTPIRWALGRLRSTLPTFLRPPSRGGLPLTTTDDRQAKPKLRSTAYLDGLRGFAAFLVYIHHNEMWAHEWISREGTLENAYGWHGKHFIATLPFLRTFFTGGHYAVATFYVISGYVLCMKALSLIEQMQSPGGGDENALRAKLADSVGSALFRRWIRLYIPIFVTCFIYMSTWHMGLWVDQTEPKGSYRDEIWFFYAEFKNFAFVFNCGMTPWFSYNTHTWSIPIEFKGSLVAYTTVLALSRCSRNWRLAIQAFLVLVFVYVTDAWYCAMFIGGALICDLDLLAARDQLPFPDLFGRLSEHKNKIFGALLAISMLLGGVPSHTGNVEDLRANPGWRTLASLKPQAVLDYKWFFLLWASLLLVASTRHIGPLRRFLEGRFCQYLGRVSYALYLVHGPMIRTLGDRLYAAVGWERPNVAERMVHLGGWYNAFPITKAGPLGMEPAFLLPHIILLPATLWVAELVTRGVDEPTVRFAQWLFRRTQGQGGTGTVGKALA